MSVEQDVLERLDRLGVAYYVTGSWALSVHAEPRTTRDIDVVCRLDVESYERLVRPAFEQDFLVNDPIDLGGRWIGGLLHKADIVRVDLIFGRDDAWARSAFERRRLIEHPGLGQAWVISKEDLILAKLEWSDGGASELQIRDCRSIVRIGGDLDWTYVETHADALGVRELVEAIRHG